MPQPPTEPDDGAHEDGVSADLFHLMVDSVRDYAMFMLSPTGHIRTWNAGAERIKGYAAGEIIGQHFSVFYPTAEVRAGKPEYALRVASDAGRFEDAGWRIRKDGTRFWADVVITAVRDPDGDLVGFAKVTRDLSERKQAEVEREILLEAERAAREQAEAAWSRLEALQAITEIGLAHVALPALADALTARVQEVFAADCVGIVLYDGEVAQPLAEHATGATGGLAVRDEIVRRVLGQRAPLLLQQGHEGLGRAVSGSWMGVPLSAEEHMLGVLYVGTALAGRFRDDDLGLLQMIGARATLAIGHARAVEAEQEARAQMLAARESEQHRNEFIAVAAHELKTPLTAIRVAAQMAARMLGEGHAALPLAEQVVAQSGRLNRLVAALLDSSRADLGRLEMAPEPADVSAIVEGVVRSARQTSNREVTLHADQEGGLVAQVDPLRFEQVVMNLVDNALKYSPTATTVEVTLRRETDGLLLAVRDYGLGIPEESRERVFERFFQAHVESKQSGLGLGLYISRQIVEAHGGEITADFPGDGGSIFTVRLPLQGG